MDYRSELGPLDVQMVQQNELFARKSGLLSRSAFDALGDVAFQIYEKLMLSISLKSGGRISFGVASELSAKMASSMLAPVFAQINPDVVGGENRDLNVAIEYGKRLAERSDSAPPEAVHALVNYYPSHDFIIDEIEAKTLFNCVVQPKESLLDLVGELSGFVYDESQHEVVLALSGVLLKGDNDDQVQDQDGSVGVDNVNSNDLQNEDGRKDRGGHSTSSAEGRKNGAGGPAVDGTSHTDEGPDAILGADADRAMNGEGQ